MRVPMTLFVATAAFVFCGRVAASTVSWPSATCTSTLQACIDGATDGDRVQISPATIVDEDIDLAGRNLTLTTPGSAYAQFAPGRSIEAITSGGAGVTLTLSRLHLTDGHIWVAQQTAGTSTYAIDHVAIDRVAGAPYLRVGVLGANANATVRENRVTGAPASLNNGLIEFVAQGGTLNAYAAYNRVVRDSGASADGAGILVDYAAGSGTSTGYVRIFGNEVRGVFNRAAIYFSEGLFASTASSYIAVAVGNVAVCDAGGAAGSGIGFVVNDGSIAVQAVNNSVTGCYSAIGASHWEGSSGTPTIDGVVGNNMLAANTRALSFVSPVADGLSNDYNLIDGGTSTVVLGPHTISAPAALVTASAPRLTAVSPAVDAADANLLANTIIENGLPITDIDGLRRAKGTRADIGAYESGDLSFDHVATTTNTSGHVTTLDPHGLTASARLMPTRRTTPGLINSYEPFGVWLGFGGWTIYNEDHATAVAPGKAWNVFVPGSGAGTFTQTASAANSGPWYTRIDDASTDGQPDRIVLVRHSYSLDGTYLNHPVSAFYWPSATGGSNHWYVANADQAPLATGTAFHVYSQPASPNAFRVSAMMGAFLVVVDHPLANHVPCAQLHVTRVTSPTGPAAATDFAVDYNLGGSYDGYWMIRSPVPFTSQTQFNIVIDPAQVAACTDVIFADGFDPPG
jgi:hypothetical protein